MHSRIDYFQTTSKAVDVLPCHRPACCKDQANAAADALSHQTPRKTFGASRFRALLLRLQASLFGLHYLSLTPLNLALLSCSSDLTYLGLILSALYTSLTLIPLHQILVCGTLALSQSCQCNAFQSELVDGSTKTMLVAWSWAAEAIESRQLRPENQKVRAR